MARKKDGRSYITVHDDMMNHPKIEALSDASKVHLIRLWGYCNKFRTDGMVSQSRVKEQGPGLPTVWLTRGVDSFLGG